MKLSILLQESSEGYRFDVYIGPQIIFFVNQSKSDFELPNIFVKYNDKFYEQKARQLKSLFNEIIKILDSMQ